MKTPIAITLILMGTLLVAMPALSDYLYQRNIVELMSKPGVTSANLQSTMSEIYRFGCWVTGSGMIGIAVLTSIFGRREVAVPSRMASQAS